MEQEKQRLIEEGERFQSLLSLRGFTPYSFAKKAMYSNSRLYKILRGECDITSIKVYNAFIFARLLGFNSIDEMYEMLGIDILKDLI